MNTHKLFNAFMIIALVVMAAGRPITASAQGETTILLDFEDGLLPDAHAWQRIIGDQGLNSTEAGTNGSQVLQISGTHSLHLILGNGLQPHSGQVLEPQVPIPVDLSALEPRPQIGSLAGVPGQQIDRRKEPDFDDGKLDQ